jgi:alpha-ketoglutarate-dependent taurine dioxygenase
MNSSQAVCFPSAPVPTTFALNRLGPTAAEINGLDCAQAMDAATLGALKEAHLTYPVLIFRDQVLSAPELAAFGRLFGPLETYEKVPAQAARPLLASLQQTNARTTPDQMLYVHPEDSGVLIMTNETLPDLTAMAVIDNAECWHSDGSHKAEPYQAVAVHVVQNPTSGGGDTEFCDLRLIYDALPAGDKKLLAGVTATHHWSKSLNPRFAGALDNAAQEKGARTAAAIPGIRQPVVRTHPETGRRALSFAPIHLVYRRRSAGCVGGNTQRAFRAHGRSALLLPAPMARARPDDLGQSLPQSSRPRLRGQRRSLPAPRHHRG